MPLLDMGADRFQTRCCVNGDDHCLDDPATLESSTPRTSPDPDAQLTLSLTTSLTDPARRQFVWKTLNDLAVGIDDGIASHIQISVKVTGPRRWAGEIKQRGDEAGMAGDVREL
jgi:hypothetical protein